MEKAKSLLNLLFDVVETNPVSLVQSLFDANLLDKLSVDVLDELHTQLFHASMEEEIDEVRDEIVDCMAAVEECIFARNSH